MYVYINQVVQSNTFLTRTFNTKSWTYCGGQWERIRKIAKIHFKFRCLTTENVSKNPPGKPPKKLFKNESTKTPKVIGSNWVQIRWFMALSFGHVQSLGHILHNFKSAINVLARIGYSVRGDVKECDARLLTFTDKL